MSATSLVSVARPRHRRATAGVLALLLGAAVLAGCGTKITAYGDKVEKNFVSGCTNPVSGDKKDALSTAVCKCIYDKAKGNDGLSFSEFDKVESQLRDKHVSLDKLGANGQKMLTFTNECKAAANAPATTTTTAPPASSTTVPNGASSTTVAASSTTAASSTSTTAAH